MKKDKTAVRNAATMIVVRDRSIEPKILMGQRGSNAAFMPNKFVFPGGAVDLNDKHIPLANSIPEPCLGRLADASDPDLVHSLCVAAIRELFEETGQILGVKKELQDETLVRVELFSAHNGTGIDRTRDQLSQWFTEGAAIESERPESVD